MKKFVFTLLLVFVCHLGYAQSINGLFNEFGSEKIRQRKKCRLCQSIFFHDVSWKNVRRTR